MENCDLYIKAIKDLYDNTDFKKAEFKKIPKFRINKSSKGCRFYPIDEHADIFIPIKNSRLLYKIAEKYESEKSLKGTYLLSKSEENWGVKFMIDMQVAMVKFAYLHKKSKKEPKISYDEITTRLGYKIPRNYYPTILQDGIYDKTTDIDKLKFYNTDYYLKPKIFYTKYEYINDKSKKLEEPKIYNNIDNGVRIRNRSTMFKNVYLVRKAREARESKKMMRFKELAQKYKDEKKTVKTWSNINSYIPTRSKIEFMLLVPSGGFVNQNVFTIDFKILYMEYGDIDSKSAMIDDDLDMDI